MTEYYLNQVVIVIYEHILNANKRFGTDVTEIVHSVFHCEPEMIQNNVIIAPLWKPELFSGYSDCLTQNSDGIFKMWTLSAAGFKIAYIVTGMGCNCIEMETSALFTSAQICNLNAAAVFSVSDNSIQKKSLLSGMTEEEIDYEKNVRRNILTKIVIESFL